MGAEDLLFRDPSHPDRGTPGHIHDPPAPERPRRGGASPGHGRCELIVLGVGEDLARRASPVPQPSQHPAARRGLRPDDDDRLAAHGQIRQGLPPEVPLGRVRRRGLRGRPVRGGRIFPGRLGRTRCSDLLATFAVPIVLLVLVAASVVEVALLGRSMAEAEREWWARLCGWFGIAAIAWMVTIGTVVYAPAVLLMAGPWLRSAIASGWLLTTAAGCSRVAWDRWPLGPRNRWCR